MPFTLPPLPYPKDGLAPAISAETLTFHHDKHHAAYIEKLNDLVAADARHQKHDQRRPAGQVWNCMHRCS